MEAHVQISLLGHKARESSDSILSGIEGVNAQFHVQAMNVRKAVAKPLRSLRTSCQPNSFIQVLVTAFHSKTDMVHTILLSSIDS